MDLVMRDLNALVTARRSGTTLASERARAAAEETGENVPAKPASGDEVAKALDALRAVIPATMATLYTGFITLMQPAIAAAGATARKAQEAAIAAEHPNDADAIAEALAKLPTETSEFLIVRIGAAIAFGAFVLWIAWSKANKNQRKRVILEPLVATGAFAAWAAASPGTPLAAVLDANTLLITTYVITFLAAGALGALSATVLNTKAK